MELGRRGVRREGRSYKPNSVVLASLRRGGGGGGRRRRRNAWAGVCAVKTVSCVRCYSTTPTPTHNFHAYTHTHACACAHVGLRPVWHGVWLWLVACRFCHVHFSRSATPSRSRAVVAYLPCTWRCPPFPCRRVSLPSRGHRLCPVSRGGGKSDSGWWRTVEAVTPVSASRHVSRERYEW